MAKVSTDTTVTLYKFRCSCDREHGKEDWGRHCGRCGAEVLKVAAGKEQIGYTDSLCPLCNHRMTYPKNYLSASNRYYCDNCKESYPSGSVLEFRRPKCQVCGNELNPRYDKFCEGCGADIETALTVPDPKTLSWFKRNGVFVWLAIVIAANIMLVGGLVWLVVKVFG